MFRLFLRLLKKIFTHEACSAGDCRTCKPDIFMQTFFFNLNKTKYKGHARLRHTAQSTPATHTTPARIFSKTTGFLRVFSDAVMIRRSAGPQLLSLLPKINFENISSKNKLMAALKLVFHYRTVSQPWSGGAGAGSIWRFVIMEKTPTRAFS